MTPLFTYPAVALDQLEGGPDTLVLCPNARTANELRRCHGELQAGRGAQSWRALNGSTPAQWLDQLLSTALLRGEIDPDTVPGSFLTTAQESALWQSVIARDGALDDGLFDREGLAGAAMEADALVTAWKLAIPEALATMESRAMQRWRKDFAERCRREGWLWGAPALEWHIAFIERGAARLPGRVGLFGFVRHDPVLRRLLAALETQGVTLSQVLPPAPVAVRPTTRPAGVGVRPMADAEAECRAAASWAKARLALAPEGKLLMVCTSQTQLAALERALARELAGDMATGWPVDGEPPGVHVRGQVLGDNPLIALSLRLVQMLLAPRAIDHADFAAMLRQPGWSGDVSEADARARFEVVLREQLPPETRLSDVADVLRQQRRIEGAGFALNALDASLGVLAATRSRWPKRQLPGEWGRLFRVALGDLGWPGERALTRVERAALDALASELAALSLLDAVVGKINPEDALAQLRRACRSRRFAPPRNTPAPVELATLGDALPVNYAGIWVMGCTDGLWPIPATANPLIPAEQQRRAGVCAARGDLLLEEAQRLREHLAACTGELVLSYPVRAGDAPLAPSVLLAGMPLPEDLADTLVPALQQAETLEYLDDAHAPPLDPGSRLRGGTALLQAQSICPAWAFYRYRLHCAVLPRLTFGIDPRIHGSLLHGALEAFWRGRGRAELLALGDEALGREIERVVSGAIAAASPPSAGRLGTRNLSPGLLRLETDLLCRLLARWLPVERERSDFHVVDCEVPFDLTIDGLAVRLVIDRIDALPDGRRVLVDYKSGSRVSAASWTQPRIREPQLPVYAALVLPDDSLAAVVLAQINPQKSRFVGVAEEAGLLPEAVVLGGAGRAAEALHRAGLSDMRTLRQRWAEAIRQLAREIVAGEAPVRVADEKELAYCDVLPLLRLAERRRQWHVEMLR